jgi:hypothetical protein
MKKILSRLKNIERTTVIKNSFLLPILSVVVMSISHVISWYDLGNPFSWAIYLSVAVEVFALASVSAASIKIKKGSIWLLFGLVTLIQIVGNVFFTFQDININGEQFKSWVELVQPWFEDWTPVDHRRFLALIQGGTLPFMSLIALHFYIKFNENLSSDGEKTVEVKNDPIVPVTPDEPIVSPEITHEVETEIESVPVVLNDETNDEVVSEIIEDEKKLENDQIHISSNSRRRLHPARY